MTTTTREGTLVTVDGKPALRFVRHYRQDIERVWRAISEPSEMAQWFPANVEGTRAVGAELTFDDGAQRAAATEAGEPTRADGPMFRGAVVAYDPPNVFSFTWGGELIRIELAAERDGTELVFTQILSHASVAARNGAGWHTCLSELDRLLGAPVTGGGDGFAVFDDYLDRMGPPLGTPTADGGMTWERATHVAPDQVRRATSDPAAIEAWGATERSGDPQRWDVEATDHGTAYRLTVDGIGHDAERAATWHALLVQLDMYLAAGQLIPAEPARWVAAYRSVL
ncbi:MAG: SRPBCC domain-containing protein [Acidimicrobiales bacterium]|nr:SRPBCC domain-containing protein [Acidimicrobiales bacterium]